MATEDPTVELLKSVDVYLDNFKYLNNIDIHADDVPNIQHTSVAVGVETSHSSSSIVSDDYKGYSYSTFELGFIVKLENEYVSGQEFIHMLYTYRSVSQAIPEIAIETHEDATPEEQAEVVSKKAEISRKVLDILRPEIAKLKDLLNYVSNATHLFHTVVSYLIQKESQKEIIPEGIYYSLMKLLDVLIILDNIKDIKACLQKDFSRYKRVLGPHPSIEVIEELNQLQLFLSNPDPKKSKNYIFSSLRDEIKRINNHDSILIQIIELANEALENIMYLTPDEKFRLIRIQPYLMLIIDSDADDDKSTNSINIFKTNKTKLAVLQKLFHKNPVIPLYGDMSITLEYILQRSSHYDKNISANWSTESSNADAKVVAHYSVATHWNAIRDSSTAYLLRMQMAVNRCEKYPFSKVLDDVSIETAANIFNMISEGFQKLSKWTMVVQSNIVWKYTHPVSNAQLNDMKIPLNTDGIEYARVLKHNFTKTELSILIDVISCIKAVSSMMSKYENLFAPFIRFHIHHSIQQLVQGDLVPLLHRVDKRNKPILPTLLKLRALAADYAKGTVDTQRDYKEYTRKDGYTMVAHPARVVGTSATQLYILRLQVSLLCDSNSEVRQKSSMFAKADLEKADIEIFSNFYSDSFYFPYLLDYSETLRSVSNLGSLWYREFYLEMTKCIQFPIEMSLPWILTEHIITNHTQTNSVMLNNVFYILDIYNDAAHDALYSLHTQYLYDEIEAETNLVIDQLYFLLSDVIYSYFKNLAGSTLLEKSYKSRLEEIKTLVALTHNNGAGLNSSQHLTQNIQQFETILQQKHVHLLGRSINFNYILGQNINNKIYRDIDLAIKRFESSDARGVIDLKQLLDIISTAHGFLSRYIQLDAFELMLNEINESFNPSSFKGRISIHMLTSLVKDVIPNYSYNYYTERFIPSPMMMRQIEYIKGPKQSAVANAYGVVCAKAFDMQSKLTRSYFGYHHIVAFLSLGVNLTDLSMLIDQIIKNMLDKIKDISEYLEALKDSIPPCKPLPFSYHCIGSYGYYEGKLKTLLSYDDLKAEVFQNFREVGNSISLLKDLSNVLDIQKQYDFNFIAPLLGMVPSVKKGTVGVNKSGDEELSAIEMSSPVEIIANHLHSEVSQSATVQNNVLRSVDVFNKLPSAVHRQIQHSSNLFSDCADGSGKAGSNKTLFKFALMQVEDFLYQQSLTSDWSIQNNSAAGAIEVNNAKGFHRLWSALNFLFAMSEERSAAAAPANDSEDGVAFDGNAISNEAEFGHGFAVTGCLLLHLLGQKSVFELMDFSYYILSINHYDVKAEYKDPAAAAADPSSRSSVKKAVDVDSSLVSDTNSFIASATTQQMLHKELFALFEAQYNVKVSNLNNTINKTVFHPPVDEE